MLFETLNFTLQVAFTLKRLLATNVLDSQNTRTMSEMCLKLTVKTPFVPKMFKFLC